MRCVEDRPVDMTFFPLPALNVSAKETFPDMDFEGL